MTTTQPLMNMAAAARAAIVDKARIRVVGNDADPRFELFHAASSLCSQKVRAVLHEKALAYRSSEMVILGSMGEGGLVPAEHYSPAYVRLRLAAVRNAGVAYVKGYTGSMAVDTDGFDPCVVPLLVDYEAGRVIADSQRICVYLDEASPEPIQLVPQDPVKRAEVMRQVGIVDKVPNGALLYGFHPDGDHRPAPLKSVMETVYDIKIMALERLAAQNSEEPALVAAYRAKIAKESGGRQVSRDPAFQRAARTRAADALAGLEGDLRAKTFSCLHGNSFSLADALWGVNLIRMNYLGLSPMWESLPRVRDYLAALVSRPSLRKEAVQATVDSMPPSVHMNPITH